MEVFILIGKKIHKWLKTKLHPKGTALNYRWIVHGVILLRAMVMWVLLHISRHCEKVNGLRFLSTTERCELQRMTTKQLH